MWKPITEDEKAIFTIKFQTEKAINDLLSELYYSDYDGIVEIVANIRKENSKLVLDVSYEKIFSPTQKRKENSVRFKIIKGKGCQKIV